jgi:hypothetical protein
MLLSLCCCAGGLSRYVLMGRLPSGMLALASLSAVVLWGYPSCFHCFGGLRLREPAPQKPRFLPSARGPSFLA